MRRGGEASALHHTEGDASWTKVTRSAQKIAIAAEHRNASPAIVVAKLIEMDPKTSSKSVLVPIDFSSVSTTAVAQGIAMGARGARVILLHVLPPDRETIAGHARMMKAARARLSDFGRTIATLPDQTVECVVRTGPAFQEILALAREENVNSVVIGVDSSSPLGGVALGHTADRVSRYARCPVLLVREAEPTESPSAAPAAHGRHRKRAR